MKIASLITSGISKIVFQTGIASPVLMGIELAIYDLAMNRLTVANCQSRGFTIGKSIQCIHEYTI
jgi:hypothetical protein